MNLFHWLENNPNVSVSSALDLITQLTIAQNGLSYPDSLEEAIARTRKHIFSMLRNNKRIDRRFCSYDFDPDGDKYYFEINEDEIEKIGYCPEHSTVNIIQLLNAYNKSLTDNGKKPLLQYDTANVTSKPFNANELGLLIVAISDIVSDIILRDGLIKVETFDSIIADRTIDIKNPDLKSVIPELRLFIKNKLNGHIAKGRITTVTDKKIQASIWLADKYKEKLPAESVLLKDIASYSLSKSDKEHVVKVFCQYRNN